MYRVTVEHFKPAYRRGDLESTTEVEKVEIFKTRKSAKEYIESILRRQPSNKVYRNYHKGDERSYCDYSTNYTWVHENTGEKLVERYSYILEKVKAK